MLGDIVNTYKTRNNILQINKHLSLEDFIGKYEALEPIDCVKLKQKIK